MIWLLGFFVLLLLTVLLTKTDHINRISARIVADSVNPNGERLTTFEGVFPKWMVGEVNTHKMLSKNSASSRAIPIQQIIRSVIKQPSTFVFWGRNRTGMQSNEELTGVRLALAKKLTFWLRYPVCATVYLMYKIGLHKQNANRFLEPWMYTTALISGTEWQNFFRLRAHKDAQPEFQDLAFKMLRLYDKNIPRKLNWGEWHLPLITDEDRKIVTNVFSFTAAGNTSELLRKISVARCARVSYVKHDLVKEVDDDVKLCDRLVASGHLSPTEHVAQATPLPGWYGNFHGWLQHRKTIPNESGRKE